MGILVVALPLLGAGAALWRTYDEPMTTRDRITTAVVVGLVFLAAAVWGVVEQFRRDRRGIDPGLIFGEDGFHWRQHRTLWSDVLTVKIERRWRAVSCLPAAVLHVVVVCKRGPDQVIYPPDVDRGRDVEALRTEIERHWNLWSTAERRTWVGRPPR
jgi:hypothetical protein